MDINLINVDKVLRECKVKSKVFRKSGAVFSQRHEDECACIIEEYIKLKNKDSYFCMTGTNYTIHVE